MADSPARPLKRSEIARALEAALRFAIGTCVVALLVATTLSGEAAERFATVAYLAAIFAALTLAAGRFVPSAASTDGNATSRPVFPSFLGYSVGGAIVLGIAAALVTDPGEELLALAGCAVLVVAIAFVRSGTFARCARALHAAVARGGFFMAAVRYTVLAATCALGLAALAPTDASESLVEFAYGLIALAALFLAGSLLAPTSTGVWLQSSYAEAVALFDRPLVLDRAARSCAVAAVAAMILASLLPGPFAEPFAFAAYVAAAFAALVLALECRRLRA